MKTIFASTILIILSALQLFSQTGWFQLNSGTSGYLTAVYFTDTQTGYIGGQSGYLAKTTNGGVNWQALVSGIPGFIREIEFINTSTGYIVGDNGAVRKTTNGGANWEVLSPGYSGTIYGVAAVNSVVYLSTFAGTVYKSSNAGSNWIMQPVGANSLLCISFTSQDTGYAAGQGGVAYRTVNGGNNWTQYTSYTVANIWDLFFINYNTGWFAAYNGTIRKTTNSSQSYLTSQFGYTFNFESVYMLDQRIGYVSGLNGVILKTIDGGLNWFQQNAGTSENLQEMFFLNANTGYIAGGGGILLKTTDGGNQANFVNLISPNGGEVLQAGAQFNIKWSSVGPANVRLEYSTNNGGSWQLIQSPVPAANYGYQWSVPNTPSSSCRLRISDAAQPNTSDTSTSAFYIVQVLQGYQVPDILYAKFNRGAGSTPNYAVPGFGQRDFNITGHTIQNGGMFDSSLVGDGGTGADHYVINNWASTLNFTGWTIGFWISNISLGINPANPVYLFGDLDAGNFRCYYGGSGGIGITDTAIMFRMNGVTDVRVPVVKGQAYYIHFVYSSGNIKVYKNGQLSLTVPQPGYTVVGNGPFKIGGHASFASSLSAGMKLDEFRVYGRPLDAAEISNTWDKTLPYNIVGVQIISAQVPEHYSLSQNYPNPFNPKTMIKYQIVNNKYQKKAKVILKVFDITGREVITLVNEEQSAGTYEVDFDGSGYSSGVYYYKIQSGDFTDTKKMILVK